MKKSCLSILITLLLGWGVVYAQGTCSGESCLPAEVQQSCIEAKPNGCIDWEEGVIYATGMGVPNPKFPTAAQRRYSAVQAAKTVASRNLLQMVEETHITSNTTVKSGMLENDEINSQISGKISQVEQVDQKSMSDGSVVVTLKMYLRDVMNVLFEKEQASLKLAEKRNQNIQKLQETERKQAVAQATEKTEAAPAAAPVAAKDPYGGNVGVVYTGLILDARGTGTSPAMSPKVLSKAGKEVYGSAAVERDFALKSGVVGYLKDLNKARDNDRVKGNPLLLHAKATGNGVDISVSDEDAALLENVYATQSFLREARVIILIGK